MTILQIFLASVFASTFIYIVYWRTGFKEIRKCYSLWFTKTYWTDYNIIEFASWFTKAIIIVPGLIFGIQIWWLFFFTLLTSLTLIWASNKKLLPTLVAFNSLWAWISCMVLIQNMI